MKRGPLPEPVSFRQVKIADPFWSPRIRANHARTLPSIHGKLAATGRIAAFDRAAGRGEGGRRTVTPHIFWDSDVAKWLEGACYDLALHPDPRRRGIVDRVAGKILAAQQTDGYLNTYFAYVQPEARWTNLRDLHELYCAGHLIEAAVARYEALGARDLLEGLCRYADLLASRFGRGRGKIRGYPGHPEVELALFRLYRATGEARYRDLAQYFLDERGRRPHFFDREARARGEDPKAFRYGTYEYNQSHRPVREQRDAVGHAVRAFYLFAAMADLFKETRDPTLMEALEALFESACNRRLYVTGAAGSSAANEGFTEDYDLPEQGAYAETCAAVGLVFWCRRMVEITGHGKYADVMERALYNAVLSGVSLEGDRFFYSNPLCREAEPPAAGRRGTWDGATYGREPWFGCACCPTNVARLLASLGGYLYGQGRKDLWVHLYAAGEGVLIVGGRAVHVRVKTRYPWNGRVEIRVDPGKPLDFTLHLRIPGWCRNAALRGPEGTVPMARILRKGYARIHRCWRPGDRVELDLPMPVERIHAHPKVRDAFHKAALARGPLVYCLEGVDHPGVPLHRVVLSPQAPIRARFRKNLFHGVVTLEGRAAFVAGAGWKGSLYRAEPYRLRACSIRAVPYAYWANRGPGAMLVWVPEYHCP